MKRWNGSGWVSVGQGLNAVDSQNYWSRARGPSLTLDGQGRPVVAWTEGDGGAANHLFVCAWDGAPTSSQDPAASSQQAAVWERLID